MKRRHSDGGEKGKKQIQRAEEEEVFEGKGRAGRRESFAAILKGRWFEGKRCCC